MRDQAILLIVLTSLAFCSAALHQGSAYEPVVGTWRLYETGNDRSGGFNYVVQSVSESPAQIIELGSEGKFKTNVSDPFFKSLYSSVRTYRVERITIDTYSIVYQARRGGKSSEFRQGLKLRNDTLQLNPLCSEGSHFSFVKVK
ncbi:hypothetical protein SAMN05216167_13425 [Spirosoma endophyticum]|uniref:Lipocalin-like domain-containing protein n=1 Tax=Spirosoma endophyticum TaxID=662367 RepID=A0A1I2GQY5_9BACT|nr:hypothetical protein SAMN05216167_13425 [Spirosoma endophyticum]